MSRSYKKTLLSGALVGFSEQTKQQKKFAAKKVRRLNKKLNSTILNGGNYKKHYPQYAVSDCRGLIPTNKDYKRIIK